MTDAIKEQVPIAEDLFLSKGDSLTLLGSYCCDCDEHFFPRQSSCTKCPTEKLKNVELGDKGTLWSWTVQGFPPKPPYRTDKPAEQFQPYGVGYVELSCGLKVEARILHGDSQEFRIGDSMQLSIIPFFLDDEGREVLSFAFQVSD
ncbi:MAG: OB-fold domain-containing protein [Pseudomonadota bacterium]